MALTHHHSRLSVARIGVVVCEHCDAAYQRRRLLRGEIAYCERCGGEIYRRRKLDVDAMLALTVTALLVLIVANVYPIVTMQIQGAVRDATLLDAVLVTYDTGVALVALLAALTVFLFPLIQLLMLLHVLIAVRMSEPVALFVPVMHTLRAMQPWSMVEVFMLGVLVSVVKLTSLAAIKPGVGMWGFALLTVLLTVLNNFDLDQLWDWGVGDNENEFEEDST